MFVNLILNYYYFGKLQIPLISSYDNLIGKLH